MIEDYLTDNTKVFEISCDRLVEYKDFSNSEYDLLVDRINKETNVPKLSIRISNWYKINGEYYYFKKCSPSFFFNELLGERISRYFDLDTVHYEVARLKIKDKQTQYGVISKNFCLKDYTYKTIDEYILGNVELDFIKNDLSILDSIKYICTTLEEFRLLQDDLKKMFIRNFYNAQSDGYSYNIMLKSNSSGIRLAPLYDYEKAYISYEDLHRCTCDIADLNITDFNTQELFRNDSRFQELLHKLMDASILALIREIEDIYQIIVPYRKVEHYQRYENRIKELVLKNNLIK